MKLIVGLGNFGDKYAYTYHNMGFLAVECLGDKLNIEFDKRECFALTASGRYRGDKLVLAKPLTFMNLSGKAVLEFMHKYKLQPSDVLVIYDDIDLEKGDVRFRERGSGGTHNGMRNIIEVCGSEDFARIRIGIGRPNCGSLADYVLSEVPKDERQILFDAFSLAATRSLDWLSPI